MPGKLLSSLEKCCGLPEKAVFEQGLGHLVTRSGTQLLGDPGDNSLTVKADMVFEELEHLFIDSSPESFHDPSSKTAGWEGRGGIKAEVSVREILSYTITSTRSLSRVKVVGAVKKQTCVSSLNLLSLSLQN